MKLATVRAIVTGGASGMGRAFALHLAQAGAQVTIGDLNPEGMEETIAEARELPGTVHAVSCNVSQEDEVKNLIAEAAANMGGLNVVINNAGIFRDALLVKVDRTTGKVIRSMSLDQWNQVIGVDLTGPFLCTREFATHCIDNGEKDAVVVNISSTSRYGNPGQSNYSAAKAGLVADTRLWGRELARHGIRVGAIAPGFVQTPILDGMRPEVLEKMLQSVAMRRPGLPDEIFAGVRFIIECGYFTGRCIDIDGGLLA